MLACLPTESDAGLDDRLHDHFGSAPWFTLVDLDTGDVTALPNVKDDHEHGRCAPVEAMVGRHVDCFVVGGMGRGAIRALRRAGIRVYRSHPGSVRTVVADLKAGRLEELDETAACGGHGRGGGGCAHG
jgi:predicted Fe-Mo cluster-binding NifX family protein